MINNFNVIDNFLQFEEGSFYKFELLVRNTDGENELFPKGCSNTNKNILIKSWYVDTPGYYEKVKHEMVTLSNLTGARLYVTLDRKDNVKLVNSLLHSLSDTLTAIVNGQKPSIKNISKTFASETSKVENSSKATKTIMFDVDTKKLNVYNAIQDYIYSKKQQPYTLQTKKGYHVFCYRKFDLKNWENYSQEKYELYCKEVNEKPTDIKEFVSVKENELGLVYHPMRNEQKVFKEVQDKISPFITEVVKSQISVYDKILSVIEPYLSDFTGYNEETHSFDIIQAVRELIEEECEDK